MDTGATATILDSSLKPSNQNQKLSIATTPTDLVFISQTRLSNAFVDRFPIPEEPVFLMKMVHDEGTEVKGILGMNFLKQFIIQIDFAQNELHLLDPSTLPQLEWGAPYSLEFDENGLPFVQADLPEQKNLKMLIDTGASLNALSATVFDAYTAQSKIRVLQSYLTTLAGTYQTLRGWTDELKLGDYRYEEVGIYRTSGSNLGLKFLSRHLVTFDFPNSKMYLKARKNQKVRKVLSSN